MNMQTQIDLFPLGTCYYSQILISLQIPPVSMAPYPQSRTLAPWRLGPQNGHQQEEGSPRPPKGETNAWVREARGQGGQGEPGAAHVQSRGQLTEPFCHVLDSSLRGIAAAAAEAETGLVTLGKENQHVSNSHQTDRGIMTGINQPQPRPQPWGRRQAAVGSFPQQARWPKSVSIACNSRPTLPQWGPLPS